jgi:4-coumarate--CoA ligase
MVFFSRLPKPSSPGTDVFNYIFHAGRDNYPRDKILYRVDENGETLTLEQLEEKSLRFADVLSKKYGIKPNDVISFLADNTVGISLSLTMRLLC